MRLARLALVCGTFLGSAGVTLWLGWPESEASAQARWLESVRWPPAPVPTPLPATLAREAANVERALAQPLAIRRAAELLPLIHRLDKTALTSVIERLLDAPITPGAADDLSRALLELRQLEGGVEAVGLAARMPSPVLRERLLRLLAPGLSESALGRLPATLRAEMQTLVRQEGLGANPGADLAWALSAGEPKPLLLEEAFGRIIQESGAPAALRELAALPEKSRRPAREALAGAWAKVDPRGALAWAAGIPERNGSLQSVAWRNALQVEPAAAAEFVLARSLPDKRGILENFARRWAENDPERALAWVISLPEQDRALAASGVVDLWVQQEPVTALTQACALERLASVDQSVTDRAMTAWVTDDPAAAEQWLRAQPAGAMRDHLVQVYLREAEGPPPRLLSLYAALDTSGSAGLLVVGLVQQWAEQDFAAALAWTLACDRGRQGPLIVGLAAQKGRTDLPGAISLLSDWFARDAGVALTIDSELGRSVFDLVQRWAAQDAPAAARWLSTVSSVMRDGSLGRAVAEKWLARDAAAALAFFSAPQAPFGEAAMEPIFEHFTVRSPREAVARLASVPAGPLRQAATRSLRKAWQRRDPAAARAWIEHAKPDFGREPKP